MINPAHNPYGIVAEFERRIAEWTGAPYAVAVESCSMAILLSLLWRKEQLGDIGKVWIPKFTYPSAPCSILFAGGEVGWVGDESWKGEYELYPLKVWDSALRFRKGMYRKGSMQCLSFHVKKRLALGRGGMILLDDEKAYEWLKRARFDGRNPVPLKDDNFTQLGLNAYMEPANAARAIQYFEVIRDKDLPDLPFEEQGYSDLSKYGIYTK